MRCWRCGADPVDPDTHMCGGVGLSVVARCSGCGREVDLTGHDCDLAQACQKCHSADHVGPWREPGSEYTRLCAQCKLAEVGIDVSALVDAQDRRDVWNSLD